MRKPRRLGARRLALLGAAVAGVAFAVAVERFPGSTASSSLGRASDDRPALPEAEFLVRGYETEIFRGRRLRARASADSIDVGHPEALGPLRFGFLRTIDARNVRVESFEEADGWSPTVLTEAIASLVPKSIHGRTARLDLAPLTLVRHRPGGSESVLYAERCRVRGRSMTLVCRRGVLREGDGEEGFREASLSGGEWKTESSGSNNKSTGTVIEPVPRKIVTRAATSTADGSTGRTDSRPEAICASAPEARAGCCRAARPESWVSSRPDRR